MMSENNEEIRPTVITFGQKILVIVIVTVSVTILFIRSSQTIAITSALKKTIYNTIGAEWVANKSKNHLVLNSMNIDDQEMTQSMAKEQTLNRNVQSTKEFPFRKTDDYLPNLYWKKLNRSTTNNEIDKNIPIYKMEDNKTNITMNNEMYQMDTRSNSLNHEYSTINLNTPMVEEYDLNNHYNVNDSSYDSGSYRYKEIKIPVDKTKSIASGQSEHINILKDLSPSGIHKFTHRPQSNYNFKGQYPISQALYYRPSSVIPIKNHQPFKYVSDEEYYKLELQQSTHSKINYKNDSVWSLIKLGFIKLKMIGFLQTIFLLCFKLKLFIIAMFIKFLLLMKLMKFFKIVMLPLIIISTLSVFSLMLSRSNNIQTSAVSFTQPSLLNIFLPSLFNNLEDSSLVGSSSSSGGSSSGGSSSSGDSSSSGGSSSSGSSSSSFFTMSEIPPDILELLLPSISRESSGHISLNISRDPNNIILPDLSQGNIIQSKTMTPYFTFKDHDSNISNRQHHKSIKSFNPALAIFRNILNSEKIVERIACRLAVAEKADIIPLWIQLWILNSVSKLIPQEKSELYFKTYNFVKNKFYTTKSLVSENLSEWCLENYG